MSRFVMGLGWQPMKEFDGEPIYKNEIREKKIKRILNDVKF